MKNLIHLLFLISPVMSFAMGLECPNCLRKTQQAPAELKAKYAILEPSLFESSREILNKKSYSISKYTLKFLHDDGQVKPVIFEFYRTKKFTGPRPTITVLPITGGKYKLSKFIARWLVKKGYNAVVVFRAEDWFQPNHSMTQLEGLFRRAIIEQRSVLQWLRQRPEVNVEMMGTLGTSLGAFASVVISALEPRLKVNAVIMGGQNASEIFPISKESTVSNWRIARMAITGNTIKEFSTRAKKIFKTDPLNFSKYVNPQNVIQFITTKDKHVPTKYQWELWEAMQRPRVYTYKIGHYTSIIYLPFLLSTLKKELQQRL